MRIHQSNLTIRRLSNKATRLSSHNPQNQYHALHHRHHFHRAWLVVAVVAHRSSGHGGCNCFALSHHVFHEIALTYHDMDALAQQITFAHHGIDAGDALAHHGIVDYEIALAHHEVDTRAHYDSDPGGDAFARHDIGRL
jgi:hypothetical protein